jgi:uncharacterized protein YdeI (YjbR/CyaY-like superfamily)
MDITFFESPAGFRKWLEKHHATERELWVGYHKKDSGKPSIMWPESVDEALCFGWIDGVRKSVDETSYKIRFTPRRTGSIWSAVNIKRAQELIETGRMRPAGLEAFQNRKEDRARLYSYEQEGAKLSGEYERKLKADPKAWEFFRAQPPWYQRTSSWWIMSAKKEETRLKRLDQLIADSAQGRTIPPLTRNKKSK